MADAADLHLELLDLQHRVRLRVSLPWIDIDGPGFARHRREGRPVLRFEQIPLDVSDLRLTSARPPKCCTAAAPWTPTITARAAPALSAAVRTGVGWYRAGLVARTADRHNGAPAASATPEDETLDQVLALAMRPFLSRCAEAFQPRPELAPGRTATARCAAASRISR